MDSEKYLVELIDKRIKSFKSSADWFNRKYKMLSISIFLITAIITIIAGIGNFSFYFIKSNTIIIFLGAISSFISGWKSIFSPKESYYLYTITLSKLRALRDNLSFDISKVGSGNVSKDNIDKYFLYYQKILEEHNNEWCKIKNNNSNKYTKNNVKSFGGDL